MVKSRLLFNINISKKKLNYQLVIKVLRSFKYFQRSSKAILNVVD